MEANLVMQMKNRVQKVIPVPNEVTVIGRQHNCDFRIPLESISRRHCEVHCNKNQVVLRDLGSRNGTLLNGTKISNSEKLLEPGDCIQIGPITFVLQVDGQPGSESLEPQKPGHQESAVLEEDSLENGLEDGLDDSLGGSDDLDMIDLDDLDDLDLDDI
jgi:pSer/pThr/pTyr-binding forkhead associated (FHA) protein